MCSGMGMKTNFGSKFWESSPKILGFLRFLFHVFAPLRSQYGKISSIKKNGVASYSVSLKFRDAYFGAQTAKNKAEVSTHTVGGYPHSGWLSRWVLPRIPVFIVIVIVAQQALGTIHIASSRSQHQKHQRKCSQNNTTEWNMALHFRLTIDRCLIIVSHHVGSEAGRPLARSYL